MNPRHRYDGDFIYDDPVQKKQQKPKKKKNPEVELYIYNFDKQHEVKMKPEIEQVTEKDKGGEEYNAQNKNVKEKRRQRPRYRSKEEAKVVKDESDPDYVKKSAEQWWRLLRAVAHKEPKRRDWHLLRPDTPRRLVKCKNGLGS